MLSLISTHIFKYYCHIIFDKIHWLNLAEARIQNMDRGLEGHYGSWIFMFTQAHQVQNAYFHANKN